MLIKIIHSLTEPWNIFISELNRFSYSYNVRSKIYKRQLAGIWEKTMVKYCNNMTVEGDILVFQNLFHSTQDIITVS